MVRPIRDTFAKIEPMKNFSSANDKCIEWENYGNALS